MMKMEELKQAINANLMKVRIIWAALLMSIPMYLVVCYFLARMGNFKPAMSEGPQAVATVIMLIGALSAIIGVLMSMGLFPFPSYQGKDVQSIFGLLFTVLVVSYALCESAGIFGLVLFFLTGSLNSAAAMCGVAVLSMVIGFPTENKYMQALNKAGIDVSQIKYV